MKRYNFLISIFVLFLVFSTYSKICAGRIQKFEAYLTQIEEISGRSITTKPLLIKTFTDNKYENEDGEIVKLYNIEDRSILDEKHGTFNSRRSSIIKEWTKNVKEDWPKYTTATECVVDGTCIKKDGRNNYDAHHIIPQSYNGPNEWWNLIPLDTRQHNLIHGTPINVNVNEHLEYKNFPKSKSKIMDEITTVRRYLDQAICCELFTVSCIVNYRGITEVRGQY